MCGIAGKLYFDPARSVEPALLERMHKAIAHRGPDDFGVYHDGAVGLVNRRLAIIDLSEAGHGPMPNARGDIWMTYNGEVYNFQALRAELEQAGVQFRSQTDTEVVLALYEREGPACLRRLRGMFALAIWDARTRTLFLARDRAGKKPLFYYHDAERFLFASEPKAILEDPAVPVAPDMEAIHDYLTYGYVPSPQAAFQGFRKLPPAHYLVVQDGRVRVERYWSLDYTTKLDLTEDEWCQRLLATIREAVRLRLIADVPLGAFLSGGVDSSAVVALMSEMSSGPVKTFSIGFEEQAFNELPYARLVAQRYGTDHHEFVVKPDALSILPDLVWHYNEPYADSSAIPTWYLARMTRDHVTVALNGDAGDENFAGYERYAANVLATRFERLPGFVRRGLEGTARLLPDRGAPRSLYRRGRRFLGAITQEPRRRSARWTSMFQDAWKADLYTPDFARRTASCDSLAVLVAAFARAGTGDFVDAMLGADVGLYLPDDLLVKVDIASMAHSLEARSPLVDHEVMELAASMPSSLKLRGRTTKYIFKRAVRSLLPPEIIDRPKQGFGVPLDHWFRHEIRELAYDTLLARRATDRGLFRPDAVRRLLGEHVAGRFTWHPQLWTLLMLELWFQRFIDTPR